MRARRTAALALVAFASSAHARSAPAAAAVLTQCAIQPAHRIGLTALSAGCPRLLQALQQLHLAARLPPGWRKTLTAADLGALARLTHRYAGSPPRLLAAAPLRGMARALQPPEPRSTGWNRWVKWLRGRARLLLHRARSWLGALLPRRSRPGLTRDRVYALTVLVCLALVALALRLARQLPRLRIGPKSARSAGVVAPAADPGPDWSALARHPAAWLRALVEVLARSQRLDAQAALTCRELARSAVRLRGAAR